MKKNILLTAALFTTHTLATTASGFDLSAHGFIKASANYSDAALASYNNINVSAPTNAVAQTRTQDKTSSLSFQTQQSRIGLRMKKGEAISGELEFDFIDFNKSSPTTQMNPRVRIAAVTYKWDNQRVIIGQDWDMFSPIGTYTYDFVGSYYLAGNSGFMRQQAQYLRTFDQWELGAALGMAGNNPGVSDGDLELSKGPTYVLRLTRKLSNGRVGLSTIYAKLNYNQTTSTPVTSHESYGLNSFYEQQFGALSLRSELYYGQNLANLGALTLGKGTSSTDVREFGGTLTANYKLTEENAVFGGVGLAKVDNRSEISPFALSSTGTITSAGIARNFLTRVGYEYKITPDFSWVSELTRYETQSKLADNKYQLNAVYGLESGVLLKF